MAVDCRSREVYYVRKHFTRELSAMTFKIRAQELSCTFRLHTCIPRQPTYVVAIIHSYIWRLSLDLAGKKTQVSRANLAQPAPCICRPLELCQRYFLLSLREPFGALSLETWPCSTCSAARSRSLLAPRLPRRYRTEPGCTLVITHRSCRGMLQHVSDMQSNLILGKEFYAAGNSNFTRLLAFECLVRALEQQQQQLIV